MRKYSLILFVLLLPQIARSQWGGWGRLWVHSGSTTSPARATDTTQVFQMRLGTSTTAGFVPVADARGVLTMQSVAAAGAGDITAVTAGTALSGGGTTGAVTVNADTTSPFIQTKTENNALYGLLASANSWSAAQTLTSSGGGLILAPYGAGAGSTTNVRFRELSASGSNYLGWKAPDAIAANAVYTMPRPGGAGQPLIYGTGDTTYFAKLRTAGINWAQQDQDSLTARVKTATLTTRGIDYRRPLIRVTLDSAAAISDTLILLLRNNTGATITIDSIWVQTKLDNEVAKFRRTSATGGSFAAIGSLTVTSDGTSPFHWGTLTSFTNATIPDQSILWYRRPSASGGSTHFEVYGQ